ncbi:phosphoribosylpyrophosphate synthetase [Mariniflexile litorale]|uniref:Phosphoribosylpyrophosphate synthetase n=1 Tax=Mariniflexile litorale TaxID=3045158 RepID=A0AAU7EHM5_9FLAO|nr:phosphoribosylpyrophosphate synthetase [Mariniflexile sp. KMM 9835]MDQ8211982.1 phosphoribosylpyrophosphate synthetase [Mariniflexile sp. KMM 9835]
MRSYDTLTEAINSKQTEGYTFDFNLKSSILECKTLNKTFKPNEFNVDVFYRFEGDSNPDDSSILYAIQTACGIKGLLVDAYGVYSDSLTAEMIQKLKISH